MAKIIFRLRNVPEDEATEVRELLEAHDIDFYETTAGNWGISMPALWLRDESQLVRAKDLLQSYQAQRRARVRQEYEALRQRGEQPTLWDSFSTHPMRFICYTALVLIIIYISISIFY